MYLNQEASIVLVHDLCKINVCTAIDLKAWPLWSPVVANCLARQS